MFSGSMFILKILLFALFLCADSLYAFEAGFHDEPLEIPRRIWTDVLALENTNSGSNANVASICVDVTKAAMMTLMTFSVRCYDTQVYGDTYIRIRESSIDGDTLQENDDLKYPYCSDSMLTQFVQPGRYCAMFGCYANSACSYSAQVLFTESLPPRYQSLLPSMSGSTVGDEMDLFPIFPTILPTPTIQPSLYTVVVGGEKDEFSLSNDSHVTASGQMKSIYHNDNYAVQMGIFDEARPRGVRTEVRRRR